MFRFVATILLALGLVTACGGPTAAPVAPTVTHSATTTTSPVCQEDQPCWNSCTMGNKTPCDQGATLPNGEWFELLSGPAEAYGHADCGDLGRPMRVEVDVHAADGSVLSGATVAHDECVPDGNVRAVSWSALYREAASKL